MFSPEKSILLIIDVQGKLAELVHEKETVYKNIQNLILAANQLEIPIILTEQVPEKIGSTIPEIKQHLKKIKPIIKKSFSCCGEDSFLEKLYSLKRKQIIIVGIETHVCVYQTVCDLIELNYQVQVIADAVSSRTFENKQLALERIKSGGGVLTSSEMIICELLKTSEHKKFKNVLSLIK